MTRSSFFLLILHVPTRGHIKREHKMVKKKGEKRCKERLLLRKNHVGVFR